MRAWLETRGEEIIYEGRPLNRMATRSGCTGVVSDAAAGWWTLNSPYSIAVASGCAGVVSAWAGVARTSVVAAVSTAPVMMLK